MKSPSDKDTLTIPVASDAIRYRALLHSDVLGIALLHHSGAIVEANDTVLSALGRTRKELKEGAILWLDHIPAAQRSQVSRLRAQMKQGGIEPWRGEVESRTGRRFPVILTGVSPADTPDCTLLVILDVSSVVEPEASLKQRNAEILLAAQLSEKFINARLEDIDRIFEEAITGIGEVFGADVCVLFQLDEQQQVAKLVCSWTSPSVDALRRQRPLRDMDTAEYAWLIDPLRSGTPLHVGDITNDEEAIQPGALEWMRKKLLQAAIAIPISREGQLTAFVTLGGLVPRPLWNDQALASTVVFSKMFANAMERRRNAEELQRVHRSLERRVTERTAQLETLNRELTAFSSAVSHDLRSPLRSINGYAKILREDHSKDLSPAAQGLLEDVSRSARRMGELIDALLRLTRIARADLHREPVDLAPIALSIASALQIEAPNRSVDFCIPPSLTANGDAHLLQIVLDNLIRNAWKFTAHQECARIEIGCESKNNLPTFFVRDNGAGFDANNATKLFGTFQRLHHTDEFEGHGAGLAIVQRIAHLHGGRVWAQSALHGGATFWFTLGGATDVAAGVR